MTRYRTIVADPPWDYGRSWNGFSTAKHLLKTRRGGDAFVSTRPLPYPTLSLEAIRDLPVSDLADDAAHLYLWTTQRFLWDAPGIVRTWGFNPGPLLTWCKKPMGSGLGDAFTPTTEFVLFAHRGLRPQGRHNSTWFAGKRAAHSAKPAVLLDIVETVSPGPYLEMFSRRARLGWDTWGDEALGGLDLAKPSHGDAPVTYFTPETPENPHG